MNLTVTFLLKTSRLTFCLYCMLSMSSLHAKPVRFADTYPVNKPDRKKQWITQHREAQKIR
ncbi:hypothetical protein [Spirosoma panaciterrae]|uniref:hypothetical protein n=1 Tax=Spirosoma panaciterrae TaxID=496058 RepID=UPI0005928ED5|nr:hypothetical protein [Spirosoma panaciterrae]